VRFTLPCGQHDLTFKNSSIPLEKSLRISLRAGETFKKVVRLRDEEE
jgi:hypothetical protein